jgi:uncharacterized RDD family membrane protein YckC
MALGHHFNPDRPFEGDWRIDKTPPPSRPAGFIRRAVAIVIDIVLIGILSQLFILIGMAGLSVTSGVELFELFELGPVWLSSLFFIQIGYFSFFHAHCGQTPGKMTLRIIVTTHSHRLLSPLHAFFRALGFFVSASFLGIGFLLTFLGRKKYALHDLLCGTQVLLSQ